jgi:predicted transcriptional regulator
MSERNFRSIPVTNNKNEIVGIITPNSILNIMSEISPEYTSEKEIIIQNKEEING